MKPRPLLQWKNPGCLRNSTGREVRGTGTCPIVLECSRQNCRNLPPPLLVSTDISSTESICKTQIMMNYGRFELSRRIRFWAIRDVWTIFIHWSTSAEGGPVDRYKVSSGCTLRYYGRVASDGSYWIIENRVDHNRGGHRGSTTERTVPDQFDIQNKTKKVAYCELLV
jgi:hypothetical protein